MGPISDIIDAVKSGVAAARNSGATFVKKRSVAATAMDGTCVFPMVLDGELIPLDDALTIGRAWERTCASFVLTTLTMSPFLHVADGETPSAADFVHKFHVNMVEHSGSGNTSLSLNLEEMELFDKTCERLGINYSVLESSAAVAAVHIYQGIQSELARRQLSAENFVVEECLTTNILNDLSVVREASNTNGKPKPNTSSGGGGKKDDENKDSKPKSGGGGDKSKPQDRVGDNRFLNNKFDKANDLVPTLLHVKVFPTKDGASQGTESFDFVLGVKCQLHPVTTNQMVREIASGIKNNDTLFNFIKWTTGETKFFRDFLFAVDQQKADAIQSVQGDNAALIVASKRRRSISRVWNKISKNPLTPIMSILVSVEDMNILRDEYGYDVDKMPSLISTLMKNFYLLGFIKVNLASEQVDIMIDGQSKFQSYTLSTLMKENTTDDRKFKEMMKMVGRRM